MCKKAEQRLVAFGRLAEHAWYGPKVKALKTATLERITTFIEKHPDHSRSEFVLAVNNKITGTDATTLLVIELLMACNQGVKK